MNRSEAKDLLPIIQAFVEGRKIEYRELKNIGAEPPRQHSILNQMNTASSQNPSTAHLLMQKNAGRK